MNKRKKMIAGIASLAGAACAAGVTAKVADCIKRKWFSQGYDAGHLVGFMDGGIAMAKKYDNFVKSASELGRNHSVLAEKYNKLCEDYDELEREYKELCDEYYEA